MKAVLAVLAFLTLGACAQPEPLSATLPDLVGIDVARGPAPSYRSAITVAPVSLGTDTGTPWTSRIGPAEVQDTLVRTLAAAGLGAAANGSVRLEATLLTLQRPYAGFAMTVTATIAYRLTEVATGRIAYTTTVTTLGSASLNDAVTNAHRLLIADQRAIRANIRRLVEELYALPDFSTVTSSRRT